MNYHPLLQLKIFYYNGLPCCINCLKTVFFYTVTVGVFFLTITFYVVLKKIISEKRKACVKLVDVL